jgi:hypothetical protein
MRAQQDWCLHCGAGAPGSLRAPAQGWRSAAVVLSALALLIAGAGAAAYAALSKSSAKPRSTAALARTLAPAGSPPAPTATLPPTIATPPPAILKRATLGLGKAHAPLVKAGKAPLVKTPATAPAATGTTTTPAQGGTKTHTGAGSSTPAAKPPVPIVLDTNAASTYNPYNYPAGNFGDPSLAIDGETATAWTAQVDPAVAPKMAEGLLIDFKSGQRLAALALTTATPGMTVQVYGTTASTAPTSITDPAWVHLSKLLLVKKTDTRIPLADPKSAFHFVTLWISSAPSSAIVTPTAPGYVRVNEIELFAAR